ncbi:amidohydrolase [Herbiconiux sp. YIM B11900]|uniref:amidohydrolase n=1 Tax=Herbiconiux sp. YIM B11900 TaxID=3404131 RepID=UPI003F8582AF
MSGTTGVTGTTGAPGTSAADSWLAAHTEELIAWRHHLHRHPELGHQETATTAFLVGVLEDAGLAPVVLPGGTGLTVDLGEGEGPLVALRADLDALPVLEQTGLPFASEVEGLMHACGHDVHTATLLGATLALAGLPALPGRIRILFQPAEEVMTGAIAAVEAGVMDGVDEIFMLHVSPQLRTGTIGAAVGPATASSDAITVHLSGPGGHSSRPQDTGDLVYALGLVATGLPGLLTRRLDPLDSGVLVWGQASAGHAANVIPTEGLLRGTLRLGTRTAWDAAPELVAELVGALLAPTRVDHRLDYSRGVPPVVNDAGSVAVARRVADRVLGEGGFVPLERGGAGEDFAYYLDHAPGVLVSLGVWDGEGEPTGVHRGTFVADDAALPVGVRVYTELALTALAQLTAAAPSAGDTPATP